MIMKGELMNKEREIQSLMLPFDCTNHYQILELVSFMVIYVFLGWEEAKGGSQSRRGKDVIFRSLFPIVSHAKWLASSDVRFSKELFSSCQNIIILNPKDMTVSLLVQTNVLIFQLKQVHFICLHLRPMHSSAACALFVKVWATLLTLHNMQVQLKWRRL